jgi:type II secretory pathway pseudopilin PulG
MIVLAIAGVFFVIILQVIPALNRDSRNNSRKQDINTLLRIVSQYELNNSGNFPLNCGTSTTPTCDNQYSSVPGNSNPNDYFLYNYLHVEDKTLDYYDSSNISINNQSSISGTSTPLAQPQLPVTNIEDVEIYNYAICDSNGDGGATNLGAGYSNVVALYALESGSIKPSPQCMEL